MLSHQRVELFERIRRIRKCGLVGIKMSLGVRGQALRFEKSILGQCLSLPANSDVILCYCSSTMIPDMKIMDKSSETI